MYHFCFVWGCVGGV